MTLFAELSTAIADTVASAGNAVVRVDGRKRLPATGIIWSADGLIVTANHVVQRDDQIKVGLPDGTTVDATLVGRDPSTDIAVLRVEATGLTAITEAEKDSLAVGALSLALGRPGQTVQASMGILSAVGDSWRTGMGGVIDRYLQVDLVMYPGFSGGPLIDGHGRLLGLATSALARGVNLAIPTATVARVVESLVEHGHIKRGYLGVSTQQVRLPDAAKETLGQKRGLLIVSVETDSPAEQGGLTLGDTIVAVADTAVSNHDDLIAQLSGDRVGQAVTIKILRGGEVKSVDITIGDRPSS